MFIRKKPARPHALGEPILHENHKRPTTRRDFISAGLLSAPAVVMAPIGFVSDHMEILFDLDTQARELCAELGLNMVRAQTVGTHPRFIRMIRELIDERLDESQPREALGVFAPRPDICPADCCPAR